MKRCIGRVRLSEHTALEPLRHDHNGNAYVNTCSNNGPRASCNDMQDEIFSVETRLRESGKAGYLVMSGP